MPVTTTGIFYLKDSILLAQNPTSTQDEWVNITGNIKTLPYSIFGQTYDPMHRYPTPTPQRPGHGPELDRGQLELRHPQQSQ